MISGKVTGDIAGQADIYSTVLNKGGASNYLKKYCSTSHDGFDEIQPTT
jgi:hypothetical protein